MKISKHFFILLFISALLFHGSCKRGLIKTPAWETDLLVPIAFGDFGLENLVGDTLIHQNSDNSLSLVYKNSVYKLRLTEQSIKIPDTSLKSLVTLDSIYLPNRTVNYPITLGQLARADQGTTGAIILALHGFTAAIPPVSNLSNTDQEIDATEFFESADLDSGFLDLRVVNGFEVDITDVIFRMKNKSNGFVIFQDTFPVIPKGGQVFESYFIGGMTVEGTLLGDIVNLSSPGSGGNGVPIDTNDAITLTLEARDLKVHAATAIFPAQNLVNIKNEVTYNMGGPEFTLMRIKSGNLVVRAFNTIEDSLKLRYRIPAAVNQMGIPIDFVSAVAPAPTGGSTMFERIIDLSGYTIDLRGKNHNKVNTFYNEFKASIDSSGKIISISLDDSISVYYGLVDIVPEYLKGYLGKHSFSIGPDETTFNLFKNITSGTLDLEQLSVDFTLYNTIGAEGSVKLNSLQASNAGTGANVTLNAPVVNSNLSVIRAFENPFIPGITRIHLSESNSNIKALIQSLPDKLTYDLDLEINPGGNVFNYQDFVSFDDYLEVALEMGMPLSFVANQLQLVDTVDFDLGNSGNGNTSIKDATLTFLVDNGYPLSAEVQVYFLSPGGQIIDSLFGVPAFIQPGSVDQNLCMVTNQVRSKFQENFNQNRIDQLKSAKKAKVRVVFNSASAGSCNYLKIFSDYRFKFKLTGRLTHAVEEK